MTSLVHIAPQLPPAIDGVGDYCWNLWKHWPERNDSWQFLAMHNADKSAAHWPEVEVHGFAPNAESMGAALHATGADRAVLHYVGYGFQPKGIPLWLPVALKQWRAAAPAHRVVVMFHEMYAMSSPLRSPFWVAPLARKIIGELVGLSDAWATSCERYHGQLVHQFSAKRQLGRIIPIGTNVPLAGPLIVPAVQRSEHGNKLRVVIFGLAKTRLWALEKHWKLLRALAEAGAVESVTLMGKRSEPEDERAFGNMTARIGTALRWKQRFDLSPEEISRELIQHEVGLLANEPDVLTKSGVFAALATHGVVPVLATGPGASLGASLARATLVNDDANSIPGLLQGLVDGARLSAVRGHLLSFAAHELSWQSIGQSWLELLQVAMERAPHIDEVPRSTNRATPQDELIDPVARV